MEACILSDDVETSTITELPKKDAEKDSVSTKCGILLSSSIGNEITPMETTMRIAQEDSNRESEQVHSDNPPVTDIVVDVPTTS